MHQVFLFSEEPSAAKLNKESRLLVSGMLKTSKYFLYNEFENLSR